MLYQQHVPTWRSTWETYSGVKEGLERSCQNLPCAPEVLTGTY